MGFSTVSGAILRWMWSARKAHEGSALSRQWLDRLVPICKLKAQLPERSLPKTKRPKKAKPTATDKKAKPVFTDMSTGEATVATLLAHGLDTIYALPGVHNDH